VTSAAGVAQNFRAVYRDLDGNADLNTVDFLVSSDGTSANAIRARLFVQTNTIRLFNNAGTALLPGNCTPGVAGSLQNAQGRIVCGGTTVTGTGNDLAVRWRIIPNAAFAGLKQLKMRAADQSGAASAFRVKGNWTITP
jgi:hypothetical protein